MKESVSIWAIVASENDKPDRIFSGWYGPQTIRVYKYESVANKNLADYQLTQKTYKYNPKLSLRVVEYVAK